VQWCQFGCRPGNCQTTIDITLIEFVGLVESFITLAASS